MRPSHGTEGLLAIVMDNAKEVISDCFWKEAGSQGKLLFIPQGGDKFTQVEPDLLRSVSQRELFARNHFKDPEELADGEVSQNEERIAERNEKIKSIQRANEGFPRGETIKVILRGRIELALLLNVRNITVQCEKEMQALIHWVRSHGGVLTTYGGETVGHRTTSILMAADAGETFLMPDSRIVFGHDFFSDKKAKAGLLGHAVPEKHSEVQAFLARTAVHIREAKKGTITITGERAAELGLATIPRVGDGLSGTVSMRAQFARNHGLSPETFKRTPLADFFQRSAPDVRQNIGAVLGINLGFLGSLTRGGSNSGPWS